MQADQQAQLALIMNASAIDVCCVTKTWTWNSSSVNQIAVLTSHQNILCTTGDETSRFPGQCGVGTALTSKTEKALLDWVTVNSRFSTVDQRSVGV